MPATKSSTVMFASTNTEHRLIIKPSEYIWDGNRLRGETKSHTVEFKGGIYRTDDPVEIEFLRDKMKSEPAIYEIPQEVPDPSPILVELVSASPGRVREILDLELEGWEREPVIEAAHARLATFTDSPASLHEPAPVVDQEAPYGRKADGTPRKRPVPPHLQK